MTSEIVPGNSSPAESLPPETPAPETPDTPDRERSGGASAASGGNATPEESSDGATGDRDATDGNGEAAEPHPDANGDPDPKLDPEAVRRTAAEQAPEDRVRTSRAGRDLPAAIGVGVGLGVMMILSLVFLPIVFVVVASVAIGIATLEVVRRLRQAQVVVPWIPLLVGGQAILWMAWRFGAIGAVGALGATVVVSLLWRLVAEGLENPPQNYLRDVSIAIFVVAWIPLLASFAVLMVNQPLGPRRVLCFLIAVVCSDVGGYVAGVLFGKHPMAPAISPKKSWEGLAGSMLLCIIGSVLSVTLILGVHSFIGIALGAVVALSASFGDLIESQVKRDLGIKDMGTMLPGHGGLMDRLDSVLPSAFVSWLVLAALV